MKYRKISDSVLQLAFIGILLLYSLQIFAFDPIKGKYEFFWGRQISQMTGIDGDRLEPGDIFLLADTTGLDTRVFQVIEDGSTADGVVIFSPISNAGDKRWKGKSYDSFGHLTIFGDDNFVKFDSASGTDMWLGLDTSTSTMELRSAASVNSSLICTWNTQGVMAPQGNVTISDSKTLTFDEAASNPNDADVVLSGADGVFKIGTANGENNEDITFDLDAASNTCTIGSSTSVSNLSTAMDIEITSASTGLIIRDSNGVRYRITISTSGVLTATSL